VIDASMIHKQETAFLVEFSAYLSNLPTLVVPMKRRLRIGGAWASSEWRTRLAVQGHSSAAADLGDEGAGPRQRGRRERAGTSSARPLESSTSRRLAARPSSSASEKAARADANAVQP
jgi:hypothetical protein